MLLQMGLITGILSGLLEIFFCRAIPPLHKFIRLNRAIDIAFSFGIAYLLNGGGVGPTFLLAGVIGNFMTTMYWQSEDQILGNYRRFKESWSSNKEEYLGYVRDLGKLIIFVIRVLTWPFRAARWCNTNYQAARLAVSTHIPSKRSSAS